jgi:hypothetical protein
VVDVIAIGNRAVGLNPRMAMRPQRLAVDDEVAVAPLVTAAFPEIARAPFDRHCGHRYRVPLPSDGVLAEVSHDFAPNRDSLTQAAEGRTGFS